MSTKSHPTCNLLVLVAMSAWTAAAAAATEDTGALDEFRAVSELPQSDGSPSLFGGRAADVTQYPATFWSSHDGKGCTSTLVAPRALLTAAHCVIPSGTAHIRLNGTRYSGRCTTAPGYPREISADWALCLMDAPVPVAKFERINIDPTIISRQREVRLTGFGCTNADFTGGNDGTFREGETKVIDLPNSESNDIVTRTGAVLCMGDSGGPAFVGFDADGSYRKRVVISVNSRTAIVDNRLAGTSFLASLSTRAAQRFLTDWSTAQNVALCGVSPNATDCREGE